LAYAIDTIGVMLKVLMDNRQPSKTHGLAAGIVVPAPVGHRALFLSLARTPGKNGSSVSGR
jgi:hypothetical protein